MRKETETTEMKRIDEIELVSGDGRILRMYKLHPNAKELVAEALTKCPKIETGISKFADEFATFFNAAYTALVPCTYGVVGVYDEWESEATQIAIMLDGHPVDFVSLHKAYRDVFAKSFGEDEVFYKDRIAFIQFVVDTWNKL